MSHPRKTQTGLERFLNSPPALYRGARVGLICNPASVDSQLTHALDQFSICPHVHLAAGLGPQHGARGDKQDNMIESEDYFDPRLKIPIHSLYGAHRKPTPEMLSEIDVLFCDLSDVGARVYTFMNTTALAMQACAATGKRFVVLDRPNPINGVAIEGNVLDLQFRSFVGLFSIPMRHGLTMGELARLFNEEFKIGVDLHVIPMRGWKRTYWMDETGLPWAMPSPNMPTLDTATVYPGTVLIEGTNLSEGRGTTRPFELLGAPFIQPDVFASRLNTCHLPGVHFRPAHFEPAFDKWQNEPCGGVQIHVTDRCEFKPFFTGLAVLQAALDLYPKQFEWRQPPFEYERTRLPIDILLGSDQIRHQLMTGRDLQSIEATWQQGLESFRRVRERYLLY